MYKCTKGVWHKPNLSILYPVFVYISRDLVGVVVDIAKIVGVAMQKGHGPKFFLCTSCVLAHILCPASISYKVGNYMHSIE